MTMTHFNELTIEEQKIIVEQAGKTFDNEITEEGYIEFFLVEDFSVRMEYENVNLVEVKAFADMPAQ